MAVIEINSENFKKEIIESKIPVIVDFYADWCGPCQMMRPVFEELSSQYAGKLKFAKVNTEESQGLASEYHISGIPCLVLMSKGKESGRITGFTPKELLKQKIDSLLLSIKK